MTKITLISQIINLLDKNIFRELVKKHQTDKHSKGINSWTHVVSMIFCQFSKSNSLRDISNGLRSATGNLNHLGISKPPSKSTLSYINEHRSNELFKEYYFRLFENLYAMANFKQKKLRIKQKIYLMDATVISLCLSIFDWAKYKTQKGAVKLHTILDFDSCLPVYVNMSEGSKHEVKDAQNIIFPAGSVVVMDRGYLDFTMLNNWQNSKIIFVTRLKDNIRFRCLECRSNHEDPDDYILRDEYIELTDEKSKAKYPGKLRLIVVKREDNKDTIEIITNNFNWTAKTISEVYKSRWQIEIFFKEVKQLLKIKSFVGTSPNAVLIQIWTAMITILILKYLKKIAKYGWHLSNLVAFIRLNIFVKIDLQLWLDHPFEVEDSPSVDDFQLSMFKF